MNRPLSARRRARRGGFTLMEVLLVLAILVILGSLAAVSFRGVQNESDIKAAKIQADSLAQGVGLYETTFKKFPTSLDALVAVPPDVDQGVWQRIIAPIFASGKLPKDPWGNDYRLTVPGTHNPNGFDVYSTGPDGVENSSDDVGNWSMQP